MIWDFLYYKFDFYGIIMTYYVIISTFMPYNVIHTTFVFNFDFLCRLIFSTFHLINIAFMSKLISCFHIFHNLRGKYDISFYLLKVLYE